MIKLRIFYYELNRAIFSKAYAFLLLLVCVYSVYALKTIVLRGFANTAPFSEWTFMKYLFSISPFLVAILLFYVSRLFSPHEKNVERMTSSMPLSGPMYFLIKLAVIALAYIFAAIIAIAVCFVFYGTIFDFFDYKLFVNCILLALVPQMLFLQGIGIWASKVHHSLNYILLALILFVSFIRFEPSYYFDILGSAILQIPQTATPINGVIPFVVPAEFSFSRVILSFIGILLIISGCFNYKKPIFHTKPEKLRIIG